MFASVRCRCKPADKFFAINHNKILKLSFVNACSSYCCFVIFFKFSRCLSFFVPYLSSLLHQLNNHKASGKYFSPFFLSSYLPIFSYLPITSYSEYFYCFKYALIFSNNILDISKKVKYTDKKSKISHMRF